MLFIPPAEHNQVPRKANVNDWGLLSLCPSLDSCILTISQGTCPPKLLILFMICSFTLTSLDELTSYKLLVCLIRGFLLNLTLKGGPKFFEIGINLVLEECNVLLECRQSEQKDLRKYLKWKWEPNKETVDPESRSSYPCWEK